MGRLGRCPTRTSSTAEPHRRAPNVRHWELRQDGRNEIINFQDFKVVQSNMAILILYYVLKDSPTTQFWRNSGRAAAPLSVLRHLNYFFFFLYCNLLGPISTAGKLQTGHGPPIVTMQKQSVCQSYISFLQFDLEANGRVSCSRLEKPDTLWLQARRSTELLLSLYSPVQPAPRQSSVTSLGRFPGLKHFC